MFIDISVVSTSDKHTIDKRYCIIHKLIQPFYYWSFNLVPLLIMYSFFQFNDYNAYLMLKRENVSSLR